jgi:hypothetical protein
MKLKQIHTTDPAANENRTSVSLTEHCKRHADVDTLDVCSADWNNDNDNDDNNNKNVDVQPVIKRK